MNKSILIFGILIFFAGIVFAFLSHETHEKIDSILRVSANDEPKMSMTNENEVLPSHASHSTHQIYGFSVAIMGLGVAISGWKIF